jgi:hypothetical protein
MSTRMFYDRTAKNFEIVRFSFSLYSTRREVHIVKLDVYYKLH